MPESESYPLEIALIELTNGADPVELVSELRQTRLQAHVSQLTQTVQLALPPAKEEPTKKGWWQFWK